MTAHRGLILAAGRGSRLKALTADRPKGLVELLGRPLIDWQLYALQGAGISDIAFVSGYKSDALQRYRLPMFDNVRWAETNMVRSLTCADSWLSQAATVISYSDIVYDAETVTRLASSDGDVSVSFDPQWRTLWSARFSDPLSDAETFARDAEGYIVDIGRKPAGYSEIQGQYMGLVKLTPRGWRHVSDYLGRLPPEIVDKLDMTGLLQRLIQAGVRVNAVPAAGPWAEVDSETDLALYAEPGRVKLPPLPPMAS